jgi:hypothetical protein
MLRRGQTCWKTRSAGLPAVQAYRGVRQAAGRPAESRIAIALACSAIDALSAVALVR